jgi:hypothetical protein
MALLLSCRQNREQSGSQDQDACRVLAQMVRYYIYADNPGGIETPHILVVQ